MTTEVFQNDDLRKYILSYLISLNVLNVIVLRMGP